MKKASRSTGAEHAMRSPRARRRRGRTLIELLVSIALSLLILLGVGTLYLGANQSTRVAGSMAAVEESGQVVMSMLGNAIRRAGYSEIVGVQVGTRSNLLFNGPHIRGCTNSAFNSPAADDYSCTAAAGRVGDTFAVWFQGDTRLTAPQGMTMDCLGQTPPDVPPAAAYIGRVPTIPLVRNIYYVNSQGQLMCEGSGNAGAPQALAENVLNLKVYYGFDDCLYNNAASIGERPTARRLLTATQINTLAPPPGGALTPWDFVVSAHVCAEIRTQETGVATKGTAVRPQYRPCPQNAAEAIDGAPFTNQPTDGSIRRSFVQIYTVRSRSAPTPATSLGGACG